MEWMNERMNEPKSFFWLGGRGNTDSAFELSKLAVLDGGGKSCAALHCTICLSACLSI